MGTDRLRIDSPAPRHAEMKDQRVAAIGFDQPIFGAAAKAGNDGTRQPLTQVGRNRPPKIGAARLDTSQAFAEQDRLKTANGRLDFGKFGHRNQLRCVCERGKPWLEEQSFPFGKADMSKDQVSFGYEDVTPEEKTRRVAGVFSNVASRYDLMNDAMSGGMHRLWKNRFVRRVKPRPGDGILDMAGGTGDIAFRLARHGAHVTVADINAEMLAVGMERAEKRGVDGLLWSQENAETLSFADKSFDAYTIAFGIRNVTHIDKALTEAHRVLKRGGRFFCLEFSTTLWPGFGELYDSYSHNIVPKIGKAVAGDEDSYRYLIESIRRFPNMEQFKAMIEKAGFAQCKAEPMLGGLVALHSGFRI